MVGDSRNVIVFDPLLTGHVIWCMHRHRICLEHRDVHYFGR